MLKTPSLQANGTTPESKVNLGIFYTGLAEIIGIGFLGMRFPTMIEQGTILWWALAGLLATLATVIATDRIKSPYTPNLENR